MSSVAAGKTGGTRVAAPSHSRASSSRRGIVDRSSSMAAAAATTTTTAATDSDLVDTSEDFGGNVGGFQHIKAECVVFMGAPVTGACVCPC